MTYEVKPLLVGQEPFAKGDEKGLFHCGGNKTLYRVPKGYAVNASAPLPPGRILGRTVVDESFEHFEKELSVDASVAASSETIGIDVNAGSASSLRSSEDSLYALHDIFIPLWTVYLEDMSGFDDQEIAEELGREECKTIKEELDRLRIELNASQIFNMEIQGKSWGKLKPHSEQKLNDLTFQDLIDEVHAELLKQKESDPSLVENLKVIEEELAGKLAEQVRRIRLLRKRFFEKFGTHYVRRAWVGGSVRLTLTILRSAQVSKSEIQQGIRASLPVLGVSASREMKESQEKLASTATISVTGQGGDNSLMANFTSLDFTNLPAWLESVKLNPQVIHFDVAGVWTLIKNPKLAEDLRSEYEFLMTLQPALSTVLYYKSTLLFIRGVEYAEYDCITRKVLSVGKLGQLSGIREWLSAEDMEASDEENKEKEKGEARNARRSFHTVDAALSFENDDEHDLPKRHRGNIYFFKGHQYICYSAAKENKIWTLGRVGEDYPRPIQGVDPDTGKKLWPGMPFRRIDAAVSWGDGKAYFFAGGQYVRYDIHSDEADPGYPKPIQGNWYGVTFDQIDAAVAFGNGKIYFFRGDQYIRYDMRNLTADAGYPKYLIGSDIDDWNFE